MVVAVRVIAQKADSGAAVFELRMRMNTQRVARSTSTKRDRRRVSSAIRDRYEGVRIHRP